MKTEKYTVLFLILCLFFSACKEISFNEPQPAGVPALTSVPKNLQGWYQGEDKKSKEISDTLIIESWGYRFKDKEEKDVLGRGVLSDSLILKFYKDYYFINFRSGDQWVLRLIKQHPNGSFEFLGIDLGDDTSQKEIIRKMSRKFKVIEIKKESETFYQINPTKDQLVQLIKEGYFTGSELSKVR